MVKVCQSLEVSVFVPICSNDRVLTIQHRILALTDALYVIVVL